MQITSPAFVNESRIPAKYTCSGENISPPLEFLDIPQGTESLVLMIEDRDAKANPWVHWLIFNIPTSSTKVSEGKIPDGAVEGIANGGTHGYEGPCPDVMHRYDFILYALNTTLKLPDTADRKIVLEAMQSFVITEATLTGLYSKD
jgi:Raf kinase inhibitor-like YbhB/YbcL family protein